ncbi:hypothetical protein [Nostoc sp. FACHB-280]|uniref:hypothetical protein n=1 Tax=Nostoc sp. FACHB-280 TaxID=2692839 RepID=UPI00168AF1C8|nr:hypothetical protein [Nostoc sp. FACHB-280]MBD2493138.1 hypothetical protein [Nostoc sp. FACHB-280]
MARITISDLYPSSDEQYITELTAGEATKVEAGASSSFITIDTNDLIKTQQNINNILRDVSAEIEQTIAGLQQQQQQPNNRYGQRSRYGGYYNDY